jgi:hypothetical protein
LTKELLDDVVIRDPQVRLEDYIEPPQPLPRTIGSMVYQMTGDTTAFAAGFRRAKESMQRFSEQLYAHELRRRRKRMVD